MHKYSLEDVVRCGSAPNRDSSITFSCCQVNQQSIKLICDDLTVKFILYSLNFIIENEDLIKYHITIDFSYISLARDTTVVREHWLASHEEKTLLLCNLPNISTRILVNTPVDHE
jgi:hypothetical protein